jgi:hypothetical protein
VSGANAKFGVLVRSRRNALLEWFDRMVACYEERLSDEERQALHRWEASPTFTRTSDWSGWRRYIGNRPGSASASPIPIRRRA